MTPSPRDDAPARRVAPAPVVHDRGAAIGQGFTWLATWSLRLLLVAAAAVVLGLLVGRLWSVVLPVLLALLLASVLWPPTAWLRRRGVPPALAAAAVLLGSLVLLFGLLGSLAPSVASQVGDIAVQAGQGLRKVQAYVTGPPLNLADAQVDAAVQGLTDRLQGSAAALASGVLTGVTAVGSLLVTGALALVLTFFFIKDGPRFLPWLRHVVGARAGDHLEVVLTRSWATLGSFIQGQAVVGLVDAVLIGIGLVLVGVPLALPLAVLTFFGGFIPIVGAFVVGALAVLVALVTKGTTAALIVPRSSSRCSRSRATSCSRCCRARACACTPGSSSSPSRPAAGCTASRARSCRCRSRRSPRSSCATSTRSSTGRPGPAAEPATDAEADADAGGLAAETGARAVRLPTTPGHRVAERHLVVTRPVWPPVGLWP